jgi:SAM-dependent methyltransferase
MCQHLIQGDIVGEQESVVELGCGCGLVSLIGGMFGNKSTRLWVATDVDSEALQLCRKNFDLQGCHNKVNDRMRIQKLAWGDKDQIKKLLEQIGNCEGGLKRFDSIIGADIIYPDTSNETLDALFQTVNTLLKSDGTFWLAFATRDGPKTPSRLLLAAGEAGFAVSILPPLAADVLKKLPPLLDSKLLVLRRDPDAIEHNLRRIDDVFPGLHAALERLENPSSDEEWEAPFAD